MKKIQGTVTTPKGFEAAAYAAGIKYQNRTDMAIIYSTSPCISAGVYTTNVVKAAPVLWDKAITDSKELVNAVVVNSGIANACTGAEGFSYCEEIVKTTQEALHITHQILLGSTGVIGMQLPLDKIKKGVEKLATLKEATLTKGQMAARAIMTTDTKAKEIAVEIKVGEQTVTLGAMAKGSGMIHPNMCTMLAFIMTDANIEKEALQAALSEDVVSTYNMISVDGDTSTNDTVLLLANGQAKNPIIKKGTTEFAAFQEALHYINEYLAKEIAGDGEGATALFEVQIKGAKTIEDARIIAKSVACSNLTKTAIAGHDANWGRILCAMGYSGVIFNPDQAKLYFESEAGKILIMEEGVGVSFDEEKASKILSEKKVKALIELKEGTSTATAWGCDLTHGYIDINADYRS